MKVQEVLLPDNRRRYILLTPAGEPVGVVAEYLKYLDYAGKSVNTLKTYCYALKRYFDYLETENIDYANANIEHLSNFTVWLRFPVYLSKDIKTAQGTKPLCCEKTVNLILSVVGSFYGYLYSHKTNSIQIVDKMFRQIIIMGPHKYKHFLYHVNKGKSIRKNILKLKEPVKKIRRLSKEQVEILYLSATNIRDKFLIQLLFETGMRIGEVLSLFIEDFIYDLSSGHRIKLTYRGDLINGARLKTGERTIHISQHLMNLYDDYLYEILDSLEADTNFVFVKLKGKNCGEPMSYTDVSATFKVLKNKTGINASPHLFRHTHASMFYHQTKDIKQTQERLGHAQIQTTLAMYLHLSDEELRETWGKSQSHFQL